MNQEKNGPRTDSWLMHNVSKWPTILGHYALKGKGTKANTLNQDEAWPLKAVSFTILDLSNAKVAII